jgi:coronin-7
MSYTPHLRPLSHHRCPGPHQGISFLKKNACEVQNVEFARALRLTEFSVEIWSFTVPRVKSEFFQDDLFPPTKVLWEPTMTSREWFSGNNDDPYRISLKPANMKSLTDASGNGSSRPAAIESKVVKPSKPPVALSANSNLNNSEAVRRQQQKVEDALREKFNLNFEIGQENPNDVDEADWTE